MRMVLSKGALFWLCTRLKEATAIKGRSFKSWRGRVISTNIYCSLKFNKYGRFILVITVNGQTRAVIIMPENKFNEGWSGLVTMIENFINSDTGVQGAINTTRDASKKPCIKVNGLRESLK